MTVVVTVGSLAVSILLGIVFAAFRTSESRVLRGVTHVYIEVFRSVPVLTQLFVIYFGLAAVGFRRSPIPAALVGFVGPEGGHEPFGDGSVGGLDELPAPEKGWPRGRRAAASRARPMRMGHDGFLSGRDARRGRGPSRPGGGDGQA